MPRDVQEMVIKKFGIKEGQEIIDNFGLYFGAEFRFSSATKNQIARAINVVRGHLSQARLEAQHIAARRTEQIF